MIRVNLLPHREEARKARRQQFYTFLVLVVAAAIVIWFVGFSVISGYISSQQSKNEFLKAETVKLDKQIKEIKSLEDETNALMERKRVIELLEANRAETVHMFNELATRVPDGVFIKKLTQSGGKINISGYAVANARVSALMRSLDESPIFEKPELIEIKAETTANRRLNAFSMNVQLKRQAGNDPKNAGNIPTKPAGDAATADKAVADKAAADKAAADKAAADKSAAGATDKDKAAADKAAGDKSASGKPAVENKDTKR